MQPTSPLMLTPKASKWPRGGPLPTIIAVAAVLLPAIGFIVWLWTIKGRSALVASTETATPDPDPPVTPPPAKDLIKPAANELAGRIPLDKRLELLLHAAAVVPDVDHQFVANNRVPRWEIRFPNGNTPDSYARQLDSLGIELGVIGGSDKIIYASGFTKERPNRREGLPTDEPRFYMTWRSGAMRNLDSALLSRADIQNSERIVAQFYPKQLEKKLADLERQFADKHDLSEVLHTVFAVAPTDTSYEFQVAEQEYVSGEVKHSDAGKK